MKQLILLNNLSYINRGSRLSFLMIFLLLMFCGVGNSFAQLISIKIKVDIQKKLILDSELPIYIRFDESSVYKKGIFLPKDSAYIFNVSTSDSLVIPYSYIIIVYNKKQYQVPFDPLYRVANSYSEFRNRSKLKLTLTHVKKIDKYSGVFGYQMGDGGVNISGYYFYKTSVSFAYKKFLKEINRDSVQRN
ncbi:MAG: hypothetical protein ACYDCN_07815 [Bacteroidia bacterium]